MGLKQLLARRIPDFVIRIVVFSNVLISFLLLLQIYWQGEVIQHQRWALDWLWWLIFKRVA